MVQIFESKNIEHRLLSSIYVTVHSNIEYQHIMINRERNHSLRNRQCNSVPTWALKIQNKRNIVRKKAKTVSTNPFSDRSIEWIPLPILIARNVTIYSYNKIIMVQSIFTTLTWEYYPFHVRVVHVHNGISMYKSQTSWYTKNEFMNG